MKTKIIPLGERVLVKPFSEEALRLAQGKKAGEKPKLNFVLPDSVAEEKSAQGKVVAVGDVKKIKVGDIVLFSKYAYDEVKHEGEDLYLIKEENVFAIIK